MTPTRDEPPFRSDLAVLDPDAELDHTLAEQLESASDAVPIAPDAVAALERAVTARIAAERGPLAWFASRSTPVRVAACGAALIMPAIVQLVFRRRPDLGVIPLPQLGLELALVIAAMAVALLVVLRPLQSSELPARSAYVALAASVAVPLLLSLIPELGEVGASSIHEFWVDVRGCFAYGTLLAAPTLVLLFAADRRRHAVPRLASLAAALGGLCANLALMVHCPIDHPLHLLAGHASVSVVFVGVYALLGRALRTA